MGAWRIDLKSGIRLGRVAGIKSQSPRKSGCVCAALFIDGISKIASSTDRAGNRKGAPKPKCAPRPTRAGANGAFATNSAPNGCPAPDGRSPKNAGARNGEKCALHAFVDHHSRSNNHIGRCDDRLRSFRGLSPPSSLVWIGRLRGGPWRRWRDMEDYGQGLEARLEDLRRRVRGRSVPGATLTASAYPEA